MSFSAHNIACTSSAVSCYVLMSALKLEPLESSHTHTHFSRPMRRITISKWKYLRFPRRSCSPYCDIALKMNQREKTKIYLQTNIKIHMKWVKWQTRIHQWNRSVMSFLWELPLLRSLHHHIRKSSEQLIADMIMCGAIFGYVLLGRGGGESHRLPLSATHEMHSAIESWR